MFTLPSVSYEAPTTVDAATRLLGELGAMPISGGTDLLPSMKHRLFTPATLVSLRRIAELKTVERVDGGLAIGAGLTLREVAAHPLVRSMYPALAQACGTIATPTIQNMGTLGGNVMLDTRCLYYNQPEGWRTALGYCLKKEGTVCHVAPKGTGCYAAHSADTVPVLWLYGAQLELARTGVTRHVGIHQLYGVDGRYDRMVKRGELLTRVILPAPGAPIAFRKLRTRAAIDYALVLVAAQVGDGAARTVVSAIGPQPILVEAPAADLAQAAYEACQPLTTHSPAPPWRKRMVRVEVRRALAELGA
jgi:4-hydroxybenzoyl-CoA reductase subunit beta